jgi:hypothetical protein
LLFVCSSRAWKIQVSCRKKTILAGPLELDPLLTTCQDQQAK